MIELVLMIVNLIAFLVPNVRQVACPCCKDVHTTIAWSAFVRWTCWNSVRAQQAQFHKGCRMFAALFVVTCTIVRQESLEICAAAAVEGFW